MSELFDAVDALIAGRPSLPPPAERERLRKAHGLSQEEVARALKVRRATVVSWENGKTDPRPPQREAYARLLEKLAELYPAANETEDVQVTAPAAPQSQPAPQAFTASAPAPPQPPAPAPAPAAIPAPPASARPAPAPRPTSTTTTTSTTTSRRPGAKKAAPEETAPKRATASAAAPAATPDERFANGPLAVVDVADDGQASAYCVGGLVLDPPVRSLPSLVEWTLEEARLGAPRLHPAGMDSDPLIVLTASAAKRFGLPESLEDRRGMRLPENHPVVRQITRAKWQLTKRGFGPWARIYRPVQGGKRRCVQLAVLPWGALDPRTWGDADRLPPAELARVLGTYASRVITPRGSAAVCGVELMTALRPPTRAVRDDHGGRYVRGIAADSLGEDPVDPAPPEAPDEHPVAAALYPRTHQRTPAEVLDEEAYEWIRDPQLLTDAECARSFAVGIDVNTAFLAAANRLPVGLRGEPVHVTEPVFDKKIPGSWLVDLSGIELDPRLPSPFTPHGTRPEGPAWYATPTVAYAQELVDTYRLPVTIRPLEAWIRPRSGPYLDPWYKHLSDAYKTTMADLGVVSGMGETEFLAAMERHKATDPAMAAVLSAIKATVKGGIGKLKERHQGTHYTFGQRWSALERPTWRPDIRAAVISAARTNMHRKILKTALAAQQAPAPTGHLTLAEEALIPVALLSDCAVYLAEGPSPADFLPRTAEGRPVPGTFRLGVSPGMIKHEGTQPLLWAVQLLDEGHNPARHIKGTDAALDGE